MIAKVRKQPKCLSSDEWIKKIHTHIYNGIYYEYIFSLKKKEIVSFVTTWINPEGIMLTKISQTERQIPYGNTFMWNLK